MSRGKKILALVTSANNLDESGNIFSESRYDSNKAIHVLEDITLQYSQPRENILSEPGELSSILMTENMDLILSNIEYPNTIFVNSPSDHFSSISENNIIIVPSQTEIDSQVANIVTPDNIFSSNTQAIPTLFDNVSSEHSMHTYDVIPSTSNATQNFLVSGYMKTIPPVLPDPPISDDSNIENKLVPYSDSDTDSLNEIKNKVKKRKKRFQVDKKEWLSEKNKQRREEGKSFFGREKKEGCWSYNKPKEARSIKTRCSCKISKYSTLKCEKIDEDARRDIFKRFWSLTWGEKKTLINELVTIIPTIRPRNRNTKETTKRAKTFVYHLKLNDEKVKVCRKMFLNTLDIGRWTVHSWKQDFSIRPTKILRRLKHSNESVSEPKKSLLQFLESLPVMESHYCRATSQKLYLLPEWNSKESLYQFYVDNWCKEQNVKALSITLFSNMFESKNLALFKPKKDQCEKCACYKVGKINEEEYSEHIKKKNEARDEKDADKKGDSYVFTVDLQAVLMAPKSNVSTLYYKTKLQVHNLCFFNIKNKDGFCFIWNEVEGGLNAEEFASIWVDFLSNIISEVTTEDDNKTNTIIIYSDGCTYQNRNSILSNAICNLVMKHKVVIEQKFLEVGHTQMEADSMHSTIERYLKNKVINVPAEYVSIAKHARKCPAPYTVKYLDHSFFKNFDKIQFYRSIRPGRTKGDPKVTDIRALRYESNGSILYKTSFQNEWLPLPQRRSLKCEPCEIANLTQLHLSRRKITARKFGDLQQIKKTLPVDYHKYYDDLPHE